MRGLSLRSIDERLLLTTLAALLLLLRILPAISIGTATEFLATDPAHADQRAFPRCFRYCL